MTRRPCCRYHCRSCDGHFTSLAAFDLHRTGKPQERECGFPDENDELVVVNEAAVCAISSSTERLSVTLYGAARDAERESPWDRVAA